MSVTWGARFLAAFAAICAIGSITAPQVAAVPSAQSSVIGGHSASVAEAPWLAAIAASSAYGPFSCTGSVIAPRVVLTAGHCVRDPNFGTGIPASGFEVFTGVTNLHDDRKRVASSVKRVVFYPTFETAKVETDAGLLILDKPVATPTLPLATPADTQLLTAGTEIAIAGWGVTDRDNAIPPYTARTGTLALQSPFYCRSHIPRGPFVGQSYSPTRQLCAIDKPDFGTSGCFGDSGGPAIARRSDGVAVQVGIVSGGDSHCGRRSPNIFTRVDSVSEWALGWVAAAEQGAEPPALPQAEPPYLTKEHALELDAEILARVFRGHFLKGYEALAECRRLAWEAVRCWVWWRQGGNRYYGRINLRYSVGNARVVSTGRLTIHWVDERCTRKHNGTDGCRVRTRSRTVRLRGA